MWTTALPDSSAHADLAEREGVLEFDNLSSVFDVFAVPNSFDSSHAMGFVGAAVERLRIRWHGAPPAPPAAGDDTPPAGASFSGKFVETSATVEVKVRTPETKPPFTPTAQHGFEFVADPSTTKTAFAQIGRERNGLLK
jgi:hypothetical protein